MPNYEVIAGGMHVQFLACRKKIQVIAGGFGNGKTAACCVKGLQFAYDYPGSNGLIARSTYPKLNDTIRREFYKWCPADHVKRWPTKDDNTLILKNDTTINFRYIAQRGKQSVEGSTTSNLLSATYDWIIADQMEDPEITHKDFLDLMGRLRGSTPYKGNDPTMPMSGPRYMLLTANPTANWFYKKLVKPFHEWKRTGLVGADLMANKTTLEPIIEVFEGSTYENKHNLDSDFIEGLESSYQGQMRDRFLLGKWAAYEGLVYPTYSAEVHRIPRLHVEEMFSHSEKHRSRYKGFEFFDFGIAKPSCYGLGFIDYVGRVFIVDGFYKANMPIEDPDIDEKSDLPKGIGDKILALREKYEEWIDFDDPIMADPAIFKRTVINGQGKGATTINKLLLDRFELIFRPGQNDKITGITKVSDYLGMKRGMHYLSDQPYGPMLYFVDDMEYIDDEFVSYFWKVDHDGEREDEPRDGKDHFLDGLKYGLSRLPAASTLHFHQPIITPEYLRWHEAP